MSDMDQQLDEIFGEDDLLGLLEEVQQQENKIKQKTTVSGSKEQEKPVEVQGSSATDTRKLVKSILEGMDLDADVLKSLNLIQDSEKEEKTIESYDKSIYSAGQLEEIQKGLEQHIDVSLYDSEEMSYRQMQEIRLGLERGLDVSFYTNRFFRERQMHEIRLGLQEGLDVEEYAKLVYSGTDMKEKRLKMFTEKYLAEPDAFDKTYTDIETGISISLEKQLMQAKICLTKKLPESYTKRDLKKLLETFDITYGIVLDSLPDRLSEIPLRKNIVVAKGTIPQQGENGHYEFVVSKVVEEKPKIREDGSVDYAAPKEYMAIKRGQRVATYYPATRGRDGKTVTGNESHASYGKQEPPLDCNDLKQLEDKVTYVANKDGYLSYFENRIRIMEYLVIDHDIGYGNGNIRFDGNIKIQGSIHESVYIDATGDILIDGFVEGAKLAAGRDIIIRRGVNGDEKGMIEAKRNVVAAFFENAIVTAGGNVEAGYILNSKITCEDTVRTSGRKSIICGGSVKAGSGVITGTIGSKTRTRTNIEIGKKTDLSRQYAELCDKKTKMDEEMNQLRVGMNAVLSKLGALQGRNNEIYLKLKGILEERKELYLIILKDIAKVESNIKNSKKIYVQATIVAYDNTRISINGNVKLLSEDAKNARFISTGREIVIK